MFVGNAWLCASPVFSLIPKHRLAYNLRLELVWLLEEFSLLFHLHMFVTAAYYSRTPWNTYMVADFLQGIYLKE